ncbi:DUF262 domain-containing protein [Thiomicrospira microaerophila]|uniref:DUF262 domain-containing protein n=1 Tax=Thiomicrospira microaerophila TaxID=406020 RepID=UPI000A4EEEF2|nr:DUF262 domain-containing protein [Thiomicrospira microaerophila]
MSDAKFMAMEPSNASFDGLIGNGVRYLIPTFQRDYSWDIEQWEELWADIKGLPEEKFHYMGYVVLQRKPEDNTFEVIDGQQRLITLSLIVLAALRKIADLVQSGQDIEANQEYIRVNRDKYIGFKHPVTLAVKSKLTLNRNNAPYFKNLCAQLEPANHRFMSKTNKLLREAFRYFLAQDMGETGEEIAQTLYDVARGMMFTKIVVEDDVNAYKVFETLNARGVQLSTPDLLKNFIFSMVAKNDSVLPEQLDELDERWSAIVTNLGESSFTDFVRYHHNVQYPLLTKKKLFSTIKKQIHTSEKAMAYLDSLSDMAPVYSALLKPMEEKAWWVNQASDYVPALRYLEALALFNIRQPLVVLLAAFKRFEVNEFVKLVQYLYVLSIRYNVVCHLSPNEQETVYNQMAIKLFNGEYQRASHVKNDSNGFRRLYPKDEVFKTAFEFHRMPSRQSPKKIRFLLAELENQLGNGVSEDKMVLEHVCPYHPEQGWHDYFGEGATDVYDRLGNMVLLEKDDLKRADFSTKKQAYRDSSLALAAKVAEFEDWNAASVNHYQSWLAEQALQTWRVD